MFHGTETYANIEHAVSYCKVFVNCLIGSSHTVQDAPRIIFVKINSMGGGSQDSWRIEFCDYFLCVYFMLETYKYCEMNVIS